MKGWNRLCCAAACLLLLGLAMPRAYAAERNEMILSATPSGGEVMAGDTIRYTVALRSVLEPELGLRVRVSEGLLPKEGTVTVARPEGAQPPAMDVVWGNDGLLALLSGAQEGDVFSFDAVVQGGPDKAALACSVELSGGEGTAGSIVETVGHTLNTPPPPAEAEPVQPVAPAAPAVAEAAVVDAEGTPTDTRLAVLTCTMGLLQLTSLPLTAMLCRRRRARAYGKGNEKNARAARDRGVCPKGEAYEPAK